MNSYSYMDDIMDSVDTREEAEKEMKEIDKMLMKGGFKIKEGIHSGGTQECEANISGDEQRAIQLFSNPGVVGSRTERVLGMG